VSYDLSGKHVLVTGGSGGIGAALAEGLAKRGATVGICGRRTDRLHEVLERCRVHTPESRAWTVDLADLDGLADFANRASSELGGIDVLVNNAGIPKRKRVFDLTPDVVDSVNRINYLSPVHLTLALLDEIVARGGRLMYVSSVAARLSPPAEAAYAATKAAISAWAECLQVDLRDTDVKIHVLYPGVIDTELVHLPDNDPLGVTGVEKLPVDAIVEPVLQMIEQDRLEVAVPDWFQNVFAGKYNDVQAFIEGTIQFARSNASGSA
jgi:NAD(P)-dependent dehydrogenase (short-subunit alcohol dehydrogenase family)